MTALYVAAKPSANTSTPTTKWYSISTTMKNILTIDRVAKYPLALNSKRCQSITFTNSRYIVFSMYHFLVA